MPIGDVHCVSGNSDSAYLYHDCQQAWEATDNSGTNKETDAVEKALGGVCYFTISLNYVYQIYLG